MATDRYGTYICTVQISGKVNVIRGLHEINPWIYTYVAVTNAMIIRRRPRAVRGRPAALAGHGSKVLSPAHNNCCSHVFNLSMKNGANEFSYAKASSIDVPEWLHHFRDSSTLSQGGSHRQ